MKRSLAGLVVMLGLSLSGCSSRGVSRNDEVPATGPSEMPLIGDAMYQGSSTAVGLSRHASKDSHYEVILTFGQPVLITLASSADGRYVIEGDF